MDIAMPDSPTYDSFVVDTHLNLNQQNSNTSTSGGSSSAAAAAAAPSLPPPVGAAGAGATPAAGHSPTPSTATTATVGSCRQRSVEQQQETAAAAALHSHPPAQPSVSTGFGASLQVQVGSSSSTSKLMERQHRSNSVALCNVTQTSSAPPATTTTSDLPFNSSRWGVTCSGGQSQQASNANAGHQAVSSPSTADVEDIDSNDDIEDEDGLPPAANLRQQGEVAAAAAAAAARPSVSNENNVLLDPEVLTDHTTQVLVLSVMATLVKYTTTESEVQILYEYLAEASVVFPKVFPIIHSLLDAKINNLLSMCHNKKILASVQAIIQNMIAISCEEEKIQQQLHFLQSCGFGGLWRFAGPFTKANCNTQNVELFVNALEALVETCLPGDDAEEAVSLLSVSSNNVKLSSSLTSISLASPTDKAAPPGQPF